MDMLKLLSRSTNLQRVQAARKDQGQNVPSAGLIHTPEHDDDNEAFASHAPRRGTKRKRSGNAQDNNCGLGQELNFSSHESNNPQSMASFIRIDGREPNGSDKAKDRASSTDAVSSITSQEQCRRILKKHKLKITILQSTSKSLGEQKYNKTLLSSPTHNSKKHTQLQLVPRPLLSYKYIRARYGISRRLAENLESQGYREPTEVQMGSLPLLLGSDEDKGLPSQILTKSGNDGGSEVDLVTIAPTGSGKTLAFMIPIIHALMEAKRPRNKQETGRADEGCNVQALVIAPTHELVDQIVNEGRKLAQGTGIRISAMRKGMTLLPDVPDQHNPFEESDSIQDDDHEARKDFLVKAEVLVSTPLLLLHTISAHANSAPQPLISVKYLILDEADVLLDPIFREQTLGIWTACAAPSLRISLWSATIGSSIESLAHDFILKRRKVLGLEKSSSVPHYILRLVVGLKDSTVSNITHRLIYAASERGKLLALRQILRPAAASSGASASLQPPFLVFTQTISRAIALHSELLYDIPQEAGGSSRIAILHSELSEAARLNVMGGFRKGEIWILITTDLLSRGIDFRGINGVVNYDIPNTAASYVHRAGRTGRQGREGGVAVTLYTKEDIPYVKSVANVIAANGKAKGARGPGGRETEEQGVQQWLLNSLPDVGKQMKKELKRKGVQSRRTHPEGEHLHMKKMRISTKSGYDRKMENRRKGAARGSRQRAGRLDDERNGPEEEGEEDGWGGFTD